MSIEFDLSFTGPETAQFRPREQKQRVYSLGINPYSHSSEYHLVRLVLPRSNHSQINR